MSRNLRKKTSPYGQSRSARAPKTSPYGQSRSARAPKDNEIFLRSVIYDKKSEKLFLNLRGWFELLWITV